MKWHTFTDKVYLEILQPTRSMHNTALCLQERPNKNAWTVTVIIPLLSEDKQLFYININWDAHELIILHKQH